MMSYEEQISKLEETENIPADLRDAAVDAMSFVLSLHQMFKDNGLTKFEDPDVNELENLIDASHGELGAAVIYLSNTGASRVSDQLRSITQQLLLSDKDKTVPVPILRGYERLAARIDKMRQEQQLLAKIPGQQR